MLIAYTKIQICIIYFFLYYSDFNGGAFISQSNSSRENSKQVKHKIAKNFTESTAFKGTFLLWEYVIRVFIFIKIKYI
jgi:hypothetical protein